jgi:ubiquinone/menaquinone biosynthesis C-methylase UbiE
MSAEHDAWSGGNSYERYMGRWSRRLAVEFIKGLEMGNGLDWVDIGCGTGALSAAVLARCAPRSLVGVDPSDGFVAHAAATIDDPIARFEVGTAEQLPLVDDTVDVAVSSLAYNFVPDRPAMLREVRRVSREGGTFAFTVWDYPGGGIGFMRAFWRAAVALDPAAGMLEESARFSFCTPKTLRGEVMAAGFEHVSVEPLVIPTTFTSFDDLWHPFTLGAGPAPGYLATLNPSSQARLRVRLHSDLTETYGDGEIALSARAWAVHVRA